MKNDDEVEKCSLSSFPLAVALPHDMCYSHGGNGVHNSSMYKKTITNPIMTMWFVDHMGHWVYIYKSGKNDVVITYMYNFVS